MRPRRAVPGHGDLHRGLAGAGQGDADAARQVLRRVTMSSRALVRLYKKKKRSCQLCDYVHDLGFVHRQEHTSIYIHYNTIYLFIYELFGQFLLKLYMFIQDSWDVLFDLFVLVFLYILEILALYYITLHINSEYFNTHIPSSGP